MLADAQHAAVWSLEVYDEPDDDGEGRGEDQGGGGSAGADQAGMVAHHREGEGGDGEEGDPDDVGQAAAQGGLEARGVEVDRLVERLDEETGRDGLGVFLGGGDGVGPQLAVDFFGSADGLGDRVALGAGEADVDVFLQQAADFGAVGLWEHGGAEVSGADGVGLIQQDGAACVEAGGGEAEGDRQQECQEPQLGGDHPADGGFLLAIGAPVAPSADALAELDAEQDAGEGAGEDEPEGDGV